MRCMNPRKICVVTGATGGIGKHIALGMARAGYQIVMIGRDSGRGEAAKNWIAAQIPGAKPDLMITDLASLAATRQLGQDILARYGRIETLILNAGIFLSRRETTAEGHEKVLAVNHLSPFVLIRALQAAHPTRIITIGSSTSDRAKIDPQNLELMRGWNMVRAYSQSKLAGMMTSFEWARRLATAGTTVNVVHPGFVATGLVRTPGIVGLSWRLLKPFARSEHKGAQPPLYAALAPEHARTTGKYFKDRGVVAPNPLALDEALRTKVWDETERLINR